MIEFKNIHKSFGDREVLKGLSFTVEKGEILFVLGTSGTGKSVLLKNLVGLMRPTSGEIIVDGVDVTNLNSQQQKAFRKKCGMVFQHPALFDSLDVYGNIAFGLQKHFNLSDEDIYDRVVECLRLVHLEVICHKYPQEISYGMQKRVSLARTLAIEPEILLFDEPTTGLDPVTTNAINELILELSRKLQTTSIVVSHDMNCALDIADKIIVLDKGHIVDYGTPEMLKTSKQVLVQDFLKEVLV